MLGTLITGSPRSGTTLALKVLCPGLTPEEVFPGSASNEPVEFSAWRYRLGDATYNVAHEVNQLLPKLMSASKWRVVKSPHATPLLPLLDHEYKVIVTFRDLRLIVASMLHHKSSQRFSAFDMSVLTILLGDKSMSHWPFLSPAQCAAKLAETYLSYGMQYPPPLLEVWSYGFWDDWKVTNADTSGLYEQSMETSQRVCDDVATGKIFSDKSFSIDIWNEAREQFKIPSSVDREVREANERLKHLYRIYGFTVKTLDDK